MFLIECKSDNSLCIIDDKSVVFDKNTEIEEGEEIIFLSGGKEYTGYIKMHSENLDELKNKRNILKKDQQKFGQKFTKRNPSKQIKEASAKRVPVKRQIYSPKNENIAKSRKVRQQPKKDVKLESTLSQRKVSEIVKQNKSRMSRREHVTSSESSESSDDDEESVESDSLCTDKTMPKIVPGSSKQKVSSLPNTSNRDVSDEGALPIQISRRSFDTVSPPILSSSNENEANYPSDQLFGKDFQGARMVELGAATAIYCIDAHMQYALSAHETTHVARRLIEGVFKKEYLAKSTFTGQPPRAQGKQRQLIPVMALNNSAKNAIIDFAVETGVKRGWQVPLRSTITASMSQRLGELKRQFKQENSN